MKELNASVCWQMLQELFSGELYVPAKVQIYTSSGREIFPSAGYLTEMVPTAGFAGSFFNSLPLESSAKLTNIAFVAQQMLQIFSGTSPPNPHFFFYVILMNLIR